MPKMPINIFRIHFNQTLCSPHKSTTPPFGILLSLYQQAYKVIHLWSSYIIPFPFISSSHSWNSKTYLISLILTDFTHWSFLFPNIITSFLSISPSDAFFYIYCINKISHHHSDILSIYHTIPTHLYTTTQLF